MNKLQRWYTIKGDTAYVYDEPYAMRARSVSIVSVSDLAYYRRTFNLSKLWSKA